MEYALEVAVLPVSDDADYTGSPDYRVVQLTPPGSACSVIFGTGSPRPHRARCRACTWSPPTSTPPGPTWPPATRRPARCSTTPVRGTGSRARLVQEITTRLPGR